MSNPIIAIIVTALMITGGVGAYFLLADDSSSNGSGAPSDTVWDGSPVGINSSTRYITDPVENDYRVDYHMSTGMYSIYYIYLGKVTNVPIAWEMTQKYNGKAPLVMSYSTSTTTEESISSSSSTCVTETVQSTVSRSTEMSYKASAGIGGIIGASVEAGWKAGWGSSNTSASSISTTDTFTSFTGWSKTHSSTMTRTIGEKGEDPGYYRYTLFATTDVYLTIVKDNYSSESYYEYTTFARTGTYFMELDYSEDNDFTKWNNFEKFKITDEILDDLPKAPLSSSIMFFDYSGSNYIDKNPIVVPHNVTDLIIMGDASRIINKNILIGQRSTDLRIVLSNVNLVAPEGKTAIWDLSDTSPHHTIRFVLIGDNSITGGNGAKGSDGFPGKTGGNGGAGIDVGKRHSIEMSGDGKLTVKGGNGGNGGNGGDSKAENGQRRGGNGGNGGSGIICMKASFENAYGKITVSGGNGGNGGRGGNSTEIPLMIGLKADGGHGGHGGNGGWAMDAKEAPIQTTHVADPLTLFGGRGGNGGAGGNKAGAGTAGSPGASGASALNGHWFNGVKQIPL
ncbi:MAG: hypothetical protein LBE47_01815 [Methanomassiliicoccaceae archaeon]|jgi:hypothetical protein|nr:hypothetical protein [Methanomassiliicoccaceae archaeon]